MPEKPSYEELKKKIHELEQTLSKEKFMLLAEHSADVIYKINIETEQYTYASPSVEKLYGYTSKEMLGLKARDTVTPESYALQRKKLETAFLQGKTEPELLELQVLHKNGWVIPVEVNARFLFNAAGMPEEILGIARDISRRKKMEQTLKESEKRYRTLVNTMNEGLVGVDADWGITFVNDRFTELSGYIRENLIGRNFLDIVSADSLPKAQKELSDRKIRKTAIYEIELVRSDGETFVVLCSPNPSYDSDGNYQGGFGVISDITELKLSTQKLRKSEEKFKFLAENMADIVWIMDMNFQLTYVSPSVEKLLGYSPEERRKQPFEEQVTPMSLKEIMTKFEEELARDNRPGSDPHRTITIDVEYYHKDRSTVWMENNIRGIRNHAGELISMHGVSRDITHRIHLENTLRESEARFRTLTEHSPNMIFINHHGKVAYVNDKCHEMIGYSKEDFYSPDFDFRALIAPESIEQMESSFMAHREGKDVPPHTYTLIKRDASKIETLINTKLIDYRRDRAILGVVTDITEQKRTEEKLKKIQQRYNLATKGGNVGVWDWNLITGDIFISTNLKKMLGYNDSEIENHIDDWSKHVYSGDVEMVMKEANACIEGTKKDYRVEHRMLHKDGSLRWFLASGKVEKDIDGQAIRFLGTDTEITHLKTLEEKLRQTHKMEAIGILAGGIAHDFNNIMGIILGNTELALEDVPESNPAHSSLEEIRKASLRAANIVRQLLSFTRITEQNLQSIEVAQVIKDAIKFLRSTIPSTIDIEQDICVSDETILADPTQINQIMMNLCINASHSMEQIGGKLTITVENAALDDSSAKDYPDLKSGKYVKLMVSDTGPGIDPKIIDRIFDPYFTTKGVGKGSGMGLAVVHGIVKSHNGAITVDSTLGKGTTFSILFPLAQGKAAVEEETIQEIPRGSETILFVDDEISITQMVKRMFERLGYKVQTATTPQEALDRFTLNPNHFDLVITDMTMPQMTGVKLSEKLMDIRPDIPIIICTGHSALVDEEKAKELGLAAYVMKPIEIREIAQTIRKILDGK